MRNHRQDTNYAPYGTRSSCRSCSSMCRCRCWCRCRCRCRYGFSTSAVRRLKSSAQRRPCPRAVRPPPTGRWAWRMLPVPTSCGVAPTRTISARFHRIEEPSFTAHALHLTHTPKRNSNTANFNRRGRVPLFAAPAVTEAWSAASPCL